MMLRKSCSSSVSIQNKLRDGRPGFVSRQEHSDDMFSLRHRVQTGSGAHQASYPMGTLGSYPGGESDRSTPSRAEVKNM